MTAPSSDDHPARSLYRADIDGLRAIAVLAVVLFHLGVRGLSGGFVGVDVFFVISGYLISSRLIRELDEKSFSFSAFYLGRIRRLAPALIVASLFATAVGVALLFPSDLDSFARSLMAQFVSAQNMVFASEGEYFRAGDTKLLMHTWSLAVEEQFYLVWPGLLFVASKRGARARSLLIIAAIIGSFLVNLALMRVSPRLSFFLLPSRIWELALGALVAHDESNRGRWWQRSRSHGSLFSLAGLALVLLSMFAFDSGTPFPGKAALLPVIGTVLLVSGGGSADNVVSRALSHRLAVRIGLISYSLYLWHWPWIVMFRHRGLDPTRPVNALALLAISLVFAELSYRLVETPVRKRAVLRSNRSLLVAFLSAGALMVGLSAIVLRTEGAAWRYPTAVRALVTAPLHAQENRCGTLFRWTHPRAEACALVRAPSPQQRVLLWGNSHADMWTRMAADLARSHDSSLYLNASNCPTTTPADGCVARRQRLVDFVRAEQITDVVFASTWLLMPGVTDEQTRDDLQQLTLRVRAAGAHVWLVIDAPQSFDFAPIARFQRHETAQRSASVPRALIDEQLRRMNAIFAPLVGQERVTVIDATDRFCDADRCYAARDGQQWYTDGNHLSWEGAERARPAWLPIFQRMRTVR